MTRSAGRIQPNLDHFREIRKREIFGPPLQLRTDSRQVFDEPCMARSNVRSARQALRPGDICEPVADFRNSALWFPSVRVDILPGNVRNECTVAVGISVKDQACFLALGSAAKAFTPEIQPKLEWHVEPWQVGTGAQPNRRDVVDAVGALPDNPHDFVEAQFARVVDFKGTASGEAEVIYRKQNRVKGRLVRVVERTIDEYVFTAEAGWHASVA